MRGCLLVAECGCSTLNGRAYRRCAVHSGTGVAGPGGQRLVPAPVDEQLQEWLERQVAAGVPGAVDLLLERRS